MNGTLGAALALAALGLALGFATARRALVAAAAMLAGAGAGLLIPTSPPEVAATALFALVATLAATIWLPAWRGWPLPLAAVAGVVAGLVAGEPRALALAAPAALVALPARWLVARGWDLAVKVAASWLMATALLAAALPLVSTPGYAGDHTE